MRLKSCPKCKGDVIIDRDQYGWYEQCIQCGYMCELQNIVEIQQQARVKRRKKPELHEWDAG